MNIEDLNRKAINSRNVLGFTHIEHNYLHESGVTVKYENLFQRVLKEDIPGDLAQAQPQGVEQEPTDADRWKNQNPDIANNPELNAKFDVQGLDKAEIEKYTETIIKWGEGIQQAIDQMAEMIRYSASERLEEAPGSEQFNDIIKTVPKLKSELASFRSQVEDLEQTVKLAINDASKERKEKLSSLTS